MSSAIFKQFNNEINEFHKYLKENRYTDAEIREIFQPINYKPYNLKRISLIISIISLALFIYFLTYFETISWHLSAIMRIILIKLLPYWNWTVLKNQQCLIKDSPFDFQTITDSKTIDFNCDLCETLQMIDVYQEMASDLLEKRYLSLDIPVIVSNNSINISDTKALIDGVRFEEILAESYPCSLATNIAKDRTRIGDLLDKSGLFDSFFVHFQNCDYEPMKYFRKFFKKPKYLPETLAPIQYNWLLWNYNYNTTNYKTIDLIDKYTIFGQFYGKSLVRLRPIFDCDLICNELNIELVSGEILIFTNLWNLEYRPNGGESLAIIIETH